MPEPTWFKSSFSDAGGNNCIQVCAHAHGIALRESTDPERVIRISASAFHSLIRDSRGASPSPSSKSLRGE
ncbi:DUF397 domain-containing protein [Streptomyces sp. URMC 126]|uniref:DUF397 domain-containing protein n=1 Tax=Streptomyces sp. URMC 126 TaxID=3423401 RepID=UPI003F1D77BA